MPAVDASGNRIARTLDGGPPQRAVYIPSPVPSPEPTPRPSLRRAIAKPADDDSSSRARGASPSVIIVVCVAAAVLLVATLFVWNKRAVAHKQPHRETSMPTVGQDDVEAAESADQ